jgi:ABC-type glycerol-3-phosphate transport system substrate-binding protein
MASAMLSRRLLLRAGLGTGALAGLAPLIAACGGSGGGKQLPAGPPADLHGATVRAMVNQPHVLAFTELLGPDGAPQLNSDEAKAALQHLVDVSPYALPTPLQIGFDQANSAFLSGQAAMLDTWTDLGLKAQDPKSSKIVDQWGVVPLPVGGRNTEHRTALNAGFGLGVSSAAKDPAKAAAFVAWATDATRNLLLASTAGSGIDPARRGTLDSPAYAKAAGPATEVIRGALGGHPLVWPKDAQAPKLLQDLVDQLALAIQGTQTVTQSLANAQSGWERAIG